MAPPQRKKAFNRGTFLLVDGQKFDVSNIVHESTELIPDEVTICIRQCTWASEHLYPRISTIEEDDDGASRDGQNPTRHRADSESLSSHEENDSASDSSPSSPSMSSSGRFVAQEQEASWNQQHQSLTSINWIPPEKAEILKMMERSGGPAQVPGAVHVGAEQHQHAASPKKPPPRLNRVESKPGAVRVDGPSEADATSTTRRADMSQDYKPAAILSSVMKQSPSYAQAAAVKVAPKQSIDSYFYDNRANVIPPWEQQQQLQNQHDDDSWSSGQIRAAAAAFDGCQVASPPTGQKMVQVTSDLELPLHGANETTVALENGNVVTVVCVVCRATLRCINIAQYVLCPECKCLTPLEDSHSATGGVGLGLLSTYDQSYRVGVSS